MSFIFRGKKYDNLASLAETYDIPLQIFGNRIFEGWTLGDVVDIEVLVKGKDIIYKGKKFRSYKELGDYFNLDYDLIVDRLREKWSIEDIVERPKTISKSKLFHNPLNKNIGEISDTITLYELYALLHYPWLYEDVKKYVNEKGKFRF